MNLFIAEKPSLAKAIAAGIGSGKNGKGYIELDGGNTIVTWCYGHILQQFDPSDYDEAYKAWQWDMLPIIPKEWKLKVTKSSREQFNVVKSLIAKADYIVNAGDPDREGQLLIDEVLEYVGNTKPVKRILLNALDEKSVKHALGDLRPNEDFIGLRYSALGRSRADWLVGMNCSRAYTLKARDAGYDSVVAVGRVKTPTLALVVRREKEIMNFQPTTHYGIKAIWDKDGQQVPTEWEIPKEMEGLDSEGRLLKKELADAVISAITGKEGQVSSVQVQEKKAGQRLPYSLSALQIEAGRRYGYSPQVVLDTMQDLYEKKLTTYPRSDCDFLPENQYGDAKDVLASIACVTKGNIQELVKKADLSTRTRAWNDKKISAHHAIIPTSMHPSFDSLSETAQNLYLMVAQAYLAQFFPIHVFESTKITVSCEGYSFTGNGKRILQNGWKEIYSDISSDDDDDKTPVLPAMDEGDNLLLTEASTMERVTKPPKRFTPASLLEAMKQIYKYVKDESLKDGLKECSGIGTEATRASIIQELQDKDFLHLEKKFLVPTEKGEMTIHALPDALTYPDTTALWEKELEDVSAGIMPLSTFLDNQEMKVRGFVDEAKNTNIAPAKDAHLCPNCQKPLRRRKGAKGFFWGCSGFPECKTSFPDKKGKPDFSAKKGESTGLEAKCPKCGKKLIQFKGQYGTFWGCEDREHCGARFPDCKDNPVIVQCPQCKKEYLKRLESKKKKGEHFWVCSDRNCKGFYEEKNGLPILSQ